MSNSMGGTAALASVLGTKVERATAALPASTTGALFTVAGGRVAITSLVGIVTTSVQAQANAVKLVATPTTGTVNDLSGTVESNGLAAGGMLSPLGLAGDALVKSTGGGISGLRNPIIVSPGTIGLNTAATNTGSIRWVLTYVPLESGASVTAAWPGYEVRINERSNTMPKITRGGVSNKLVDPDFIAEPGTPVEVAVEEGRPDVGKESEEQPETHAGRALYAEDDETTDNEQDKPIDGRDPDPRAGTGQGATIGERKPNVDSTEGPDTKRDNSSDKNPDNKSLTSENASGSKDTPAVAGKTRPRKANLPK